uniref:MatE protein n=1 Tax=Candidatus Kentrum sp. DK TaxID=2126562 RepID=A0A450S857_9GAMM|nr:MAG: MatE protein [Candidatus Kentron sp. DK]
MVFSRVDIFPGRYFQAVAPFERSVVPCPEGASSSRSLSDLGVRREGKRDRDQNLCKFEANSGLFNEDSRKFWPISAFPQQNHPKSDRLLGWPRSIRQLLLGGMYSAATLLAGWFGVQALASHVMVYQIVSVATNVISTPLSKGITAHMGVIMGQKNHAGMWTALNSSLFILLLFVLPLVVILQLFSPTVRWFGFQGILASIRYCWASFCDCLLLHPSQRVAKGCQPCIAWIIGRESTRLDCRACLLGRWRYYRSRFGVRDGRRCSGALVWAYYRNDRRCHGSIHAFSLGSEKNSGGRITGKTSLPPAANTYNKNDGAPSKDTGSITKRWPGSFAQKCYMPLPASLMQKSDRAS